VVQWGWQSLFALLKVRQYRLAVAQFGMQPVSVWVGFHKL
jgi:hypothetical protein